MLFSVIIPVDNSQATVKYCLDAVFVLPKEDLEVIVVDDQSTDCSVSIIQQYSCRLVNLSGNLGPAAARNIGASQAKGDILVFIDSDVVIKPDSLAIIKRSLKEDEDAVAVTGILAKDCPYKDFFTQYKNLYMHYVFRGCSQYVDFLYGSIMAIKRASFLEFNSRFERVEDTELGVKYSKLNKKILLNKTLEVTHLKQYNFNRILINDFRVPFDWVRIFFAYEGYRRVLNEKCFCHARFRQLFGIMLTHLLTLSLFFCLGDRIQVRIFCLTLFIAYFILNFPFFVFLKNEKGTKFLIKSVIFTYLDMLVMGWGVLFGLFGVLASFIKKRVNLACG
jgi:glycosyltransferase involved in cell wall biosynthesis